MNLFDKYPGLRLNGNFHSRDSILSGEFDGNLSDFDREILKFAQEIFGGKSWQLVETSGSTGIPKQLRFSKKAFVQSAEATNEYFILDETAQALLALPMRYIAGKMMVVRAIIGQYNLVSASPSGLPLVKSGQFDFVPLTPFQVSQSLENTPEALKKVRSVLIGGGQVSEAMRRQLNSAGIRAYASFGMTETLSHFAISKLGDDAIDVLYHPLKNVEIKVDKRGCLKVRWAGIARRWLYTNDLVEIRGKSFIWLGRTDNLINSGGIKVIPERVEKRLAHLITSPFFVGSLAHPKLGEEVCLFVEAPDHEEDISLTEIQNVLSDSPFWQPRKILYLKQFSYTETGKIIRKDSIALYQKG